MAKTVRIGSGLGFYGDAWEPVATSIERGGVQYIASDHLAELTLAILQKDRQRDTGLGYARDLLPMLLRLWPSMRRHGVKFICNAGGLNPAGAAHALGVAFATRGWKTRIAISSAARRWRRCATACSSPTRTSARVRSSTRCSKAPRSSSPAAWPTQPSFLRRWCTSSAGSSRMRRHPRR